MSSSKDSGRTKSFDHFVGGSEQRWRDGYIKCLGGLEIYQKRKRRRLLNRQVAGVCALENLVHIRSRAPKEPIVARTIGEQTACISEIREAVDSGKSVLQAKVGKFLEMAIHK